MSNLVDKTMELQVMTCLDSLLNRANHDEYLQRIGKKEALRFLEENSKYADIIKSALLKAKEPKQYLKWEDLEFGKTTHKLKAKMNGNLYRVEWYIDGMGSKVVCLDKYITNDYLIHSACIKDYNQQFFNDLHLERVEE